MAKRSVSSFKSTKNTRFADSTTGEISAGDSRDMYEDVADSFLNITDHLLDEDDMSSGSATKVPSQQSVKAYVDAQTGGLQTATVSISSAEILSLKTTPKQLIAAPGAAKANRIHRVVINYDFNTTAYDTFTQLAIEYGTAEAPAVADTTILAATEDKVLFAFGADVAYNKDDIENKAINVTVESGDPLSGDGTLSIDVWYEIVDL